MRTKQPKLLQNIGFTSILLLRVNGYFDELHHNNFIVCTPLSAAAAAGGGGVCVCVEGGWASDQIFQKRGGSQFFEGFAGKEGGDFLLRGVAVFT